MLECGMRDEGFGDDVIQAAAAITKYETDYFEYLHRVKQNPLARAVKMADMTHNMDLSRMPTPAAGYYRRIEKYKKSLAAY